MQDVVRIDFMPTVALKIAIPFKVPDVTSSVVTMSDNTALTDEKLFAASLLSLNLSGDGHTDAIPMDNSTHKVTEQRSMAGIVRTHTLQIPIEVGSQTVREKEPALHAADFHIVLTTCDGTRYLAYGLLGTCQFAIDDQMGQEAQMTVRASVQSMSGLIKILAQS